MQVRFYFDPLCPWCWVTSHWLADEVAPHRDLQVDWRPISLWVRNEGKDLDEGYKRFLPVMERSFKLLRVVEAMRADGQADQVLAVYRAFGEHFHHAEDAMEFDVAEALAEAGVDTGYAAAYDDEAWDDAVRASTAEAEDAAGDDVGTPIVAFEVDGRWVGYFGPVIPEMVRGEAALKLWDGLAMLIETPGMFELKRKRDIDLAVDSVKG